MPTPPKKEEISFLPVTSVLIFEGNGSRWIDLYALLSSEENLRDEEIAEVKGNIEKGIEARTILNNMKKYYKQETEIISGEKE